MKPDKKLVIKKWVCVGIMIHAKRNDKKTAENVKGRDPRLVMTQEKR